MSRHISLGQTAYDAAHKNKVFHLCKENHDVSGQDQDKCIDVIKEDDIILNLLGRKTVFSS